MKYENLTIEQLNTIAASYNAENIAIPDALSAAIDAKKKEVKDDDMDDDDDDEEDDDNDGDGKKKSAFAHIANLTPTGEEFIEEALNEGVWITGTHLTAIEAALATAKKEAKINAKKLMVKDNTIKTQEQNITALQTNVDALKAENKQLKESDGTIAATVAADVDATVVTDSEKMSREQLAKAETKWDKEMKQILKIKNS